MSKYYNKYRDGELIMKIIIGKMFESFGKTLEDLKQESKTNPTWYNNYKWTRKQEEDFKAFYINFYQTRVCPKLGKKAIEASYPWFYLNYGPVLLDD